MRQLQQPDLLEDVAGALDASGLDPDQLMLEITESVLAADQEAMLERLSGLRALGVHLAIDDFGTGYPSLAYLRHLPVDVLKLAKPFVDGLLHGAEGHLRKGEERQAFERAVGADEAGDVVAGGVGE